VFSIRSVAATAGAMMMIGLPAYAEEPSGRSSGGFSDAMDSISTVVTGSVDVAVLRPLGLLRLALGTLVALPLVSTFDVFGLIIDGPSGNFTNNLDQYVIEPYEYTFEREVGVDLAGG